MKPEHRNRMTVLQLHAKQSLHVNSQRYKPRGYGYFQGLWAIFSPSELERQQVTLREVNQRSSKHSHDARRQKEDALALACRTNHRSW